METSEPVLNTEIADFRQQWGARLSNTIIRGKGRPVLNNVMVPDALLAAAGCIGTVFESLTFKTFSMPGSVIDPRTLQEYSDICGFCSNLLAMKGLKGYFELIVAATATWSSGAHSLLRKAKELCLEAIYIDVPYDSGCGLETLIEYLAHNLEDVLIKLGGNKETLQNALDVEDQVRRLLDRIWYMLLERPMLTHAIPFEYEMLVYSRTARLETAKLLNGFIKDLSSLNVPETNRTWIGLHPFHHESLVYFLFDRLNAALIPMEYRMWWPEREESPTRTLAQRILTHPEHGDVAHLWHHCSRALREADSSSLVVFMFEECAVSRSSEKLLAKMCRKKGYRFVPLHVRCLQSNVEVLARCRIKLETLASIEDDTTVHLDEGYKGVSL